MSENILDEISAAIDEETVDHRILGHVAKYVKKFVLCPTFMNRTTELPELDWHTVDYDKDFFDLPTQQGVYAFSVVVDHDFLPQNSYLMYVGKAGDTDSDNTIRARYRNYCTPSGLASRPRVRRMISLFESHLKYHYAEVPNGVSTEEIEKQLTTIFIPPYNNADFSAEIKDILKGIGIL